MGRPWWKSLGPSTKASIKPTYWYSGDGGSPTTEAFFFSGEMVKQSSAETGDDGGFVLRHVPGKGSLTGTVTAKGFGAPYVRFTVEKPVTIALERSGSIRGSLLPEGTPGNLGGTVVNLNAPPDRARPTGDYQVTYYAEGTTDKTGAFRFEGVPPGKYMVRASPSESSPFTADATPEFEVKPGQEAVVAVPLKRAVAVYGKVVDKRTGKGIKEVEVYFSARDARGVCTWGRSVKTDAQGAFTIYVKPGKLVANVYQVPEGYLRAQRSGDEPTIDVAKETIWPTIELEPAAKIEGIVVDDAGKPVAGAEVTTFVGEPYFDRQQVKSDVAGKFNLRLGTPKTGLPIRVRTGTAASDGPVVVVPAEIKAPVKIVVSQKNAFAIKGTLVDDAGQPLRNAPVHLETMWRTGSGGIGFRLLSFDTDGKGAFEVRGLWPGDDYNLLVEAEGYEKHQTARVTGAAGQTHVFGKIVVERAGR